MTVQDESVVIEPRKARHEAALPPRALLVFTSQDLKMLASFMPLTSPTGHELYLSRVYSCFCGQVPFAVVGPMIGAPQTILVLERLIALGVRQVLALGWCGSLQPHVNIGDVVLPAGSVCEEGTSPHYPLDAADPGPCPEMLQGLESLLGDGPGKLHKGRVWTTDAPFRETRAKVTKYQGEGLLAVDMETSALFTVAHYRGIRLAQVMVVSDELATLKWVHGFRNPRFKETRHWVAGKIMEEFFAHASML